MRTITITTMIHTMEKEIRSNPVGFSVSGLVTASTSTNEVGTSVLILSIISESFTS